MAFHWAHLTLGLWMPAILVASGFNFLAKTEPTKNQKIISSGNFAIQVWCEKNWSNQDCLKTPDNYEIDRICTFLTASVHLMSTGFWFKQKKTRGKFQTRKKYVSIYNIKDFTVILMLII